MRFIVQYRGCCDDVILRAFETLEEAMGHREGIEQWYRGQPDNDCGKPHPDLIAACDAYGFGLPGTLCNISIVILGEDGVPTEVLTGSDDISF